MPWLCSRASAQIPVLLKATKSQAVLEIVQRLGGHALAIELAGVFLSEFPEVSYRELLAGLERQVTPVRQHANGPEPMEEQVRAAESRTASLLAPILAAIRPEELRALEYAVLLPADRVPLTWLHDLLQGDHAELIRSARMPEHDGSDNPHRTVQMPDKEAVEPAGGPVIEVLEHLERMRLVIPQRTSSTSGLADEIPVGRMHRLVQNAILSRMPEDDRSTRQQRLYAYAEERSAGLASSFAPVGPDWELLCLRDLAMRRIHHRDRRGLLLADEIAVPLVQAGRLLDVRELWRQAADLYRRRCETTPEDAEDAFFLAQCIARLGHLAQTGDDPVGARR